MRNPLALLLILIASAIGCTETKVEAPRAKPPRPVEVATLQMTAPTGRRIVTATAASWKSEQIGFTVSGRVDWVAEQNTDVEGRVVDPNQNVIIAGDPIARIDSEKYRLQVEQAKAELSKARQSYDAGKIEIDQSFPAKFKAAKADLQLARVDRDRRIRLVQRDAGSQADADKAEATYQNALSSIQQLRSTQKAKESELESLKLQISIAQQSLKDAQIQLKDCTLYSSFRGQIANVAVVPGSFVGAGNAVATVQMMNPIKVEFEVSADASRRLRDRQSVTVSVNTEDGTKEELNGMLYLIDPVADPDTRTFTVTVLVKNQNTSAAPETDGNEIDLGATIPAVDQVWPMQYDFIPGAGTGMHFVAADAILKDTSGTFVWKVDNVSVGDSMPTDRVLNVSKLRVEKKDLQLPFLGNWLFQQIRVLDGSVDVAKTLIAGKLALEPEQASLWDGSQVRLDAKRQWQVRPGDLVQVDLSQESASEALFVPMNAVIHESGKTFLAVVERSGETATIKRVEIQVVASNANQPTSSLRQIEATGSTSLVGQQYVTKGAHFLVDGQQVQVTTRN